VAADVPRWIYEHLSPRLQDAACTAAGAARIRARYGPGQRRWRRFFERSGRWSDAELREYRRQRLREVLRHAYEHVPFHRQRFREAGVMPDDIRDVDDLARLPLLDKADVVRAGRGMLADDADPRGLHVHTTSGSTGTPLTLYRSADAVHALYGFGWARLRSGLGFRDPYASFAGAGIVPAGTDRPPFWRTNAAANQRLYSVFHLREDHLGDYARALQDQELAYIEGYPAPVFLIADWIERTGFRYTNRPRALFSTAEVLRPRHRATLERVFGACVRDQYSQAEACGSITERRCGHLHEDLDYGVLELLPVGHEGRLVRAEIVCTSLHNRAWPLIRYRVGDLCLVDPDARCECGIPGRIIERIEGRTGEGFLLPDGTRITNISVIAKRCRNIRFLQVIQEEAGRIRVRVVPDDGYRGGRDEAALLRAFRARLGEALVIDVDYAREPELSAKGKLLSIIDRAAG
jgi:phenylacetate-CoA ligase